LTPPNLSNRGFLYSNHQSTFSRFEHVQTRIHFTSRKLVPQVSLIWILIVRFHFYNMMHLKFKISSD